MERGTVKWFDLEKKYGFIRTKGGKQELFVHMSDVEEGAVLEKGQEVEFEIAESGRGPKATNVRVVDFE